MSEFIIELENEKFNIILNDDESWLRGHVYPIIEWTRGNESGWSYTSKINGECLDKFDIDCRKIFAFNFCWRGVWEGRIYFEDDEYWSEELKIISQAWDKIEIELKNIIKNKYPNYNYDD